jgi:hypothetical protein
MLKRYMSLLAAGTLSFCFAACSGSGLGDEGTQDCIPCSSGEGGAVKCHLGGGYYQNVCGLDQTLAAITCSEAGGLWEAQDVCPEEQPSETGGDPGTEPWDPGGNVNFDRQTGEYVIDRQAFEQLKRDPTPLLEDSSHLRELESGYYQVAKTGELTSALGWSTGDVLLELDGHPLQGLDALASVYAELADNTRFELKIQRGRTKILFHYRVQ